MIYRVLRTLERSEHNMISVGSVVVSSDFSEEHIQKLIDVGALSPISSPPLEALEDWSAIRYLLSGESNSIVTLSDFIETSLEELSRLTTLGKEDILEWKNKAREMLTVAESISG